MLEGLGPTIAESAILYETADLKKLTDPNRAAAAPAKDAALVETINFADKFGRVHLARLCSAVCHSDRTPATLAGDAYEFFRMLALLATRCADNGPAQRIVDLVKVQFLIVSHVFGNSMATEHACAGGLSRRAVPDQSQLCLI